MLWLFLLLLIAAGIFVNGLIATIEDDAPGGFNHPYGTSPATTWPRWATLAGRASTTLLMILVGVWGIRSAIMDDEMGGRSLSVGLAASAISLGLAAALRRREFVWASGGFAILAMVAGAVLR